MIWPVNLSDLQDYRRELVTEHEAELAAVDRLIVREKSRHPSGTTSNGAAHPVTTTRRRARKLSPGAAISRVLQTIGNGEFTKEHVAAHINQMGISMDGWGPRAIGVNLWRRAKDGELVTVREGKGGKGGAPVVYRKG